MSAETKTSLELPQFISVDDHVLEKPTLWTERLPKKYQDAAPHYERRRVGTTKWSQGSFITIEDESAAEHDVWVFGDVVKPIRRNIAAAGLQREEMDLNPISFDTLRPGVYDANARLADMTANHTEVSLCFPQMIRFCGQEFSEIADRELGLLCIQAYNDWIYEEWCATDRARLAQLTIVPLWDAELAAAEVRRNAARGAHAVAFSENPWVLGFQSIHSGYWDPFFRACEETNGTVCMHIGSSSKMATVSPDALPAVGTALSSLNSMGSLAEFLFSGVLERFPGLRLAYSESEAGWIPYQLERADVVWSEHRGWVGVTMKTPPSELYYKQVYVCSVHDSFALRNLKDVGEDNITFEVDYPHTDSTFPETEGWARKITAGLTEDQTYKFLRGNAIRMLSLDLDKDIQQRVYG